jgi:uncharacterized protein involved in high-affinity Fe2+ transport
MKNLNRNLYLRRSMFAILALAVLSVGFLYAEDAVLFPDGFRRWVHVGTGVIMPGAMPQMTSEEGMHHIFANQKAVEGYASGDFADGSMVVYELRETKQNNGVIFEGDRKRVDVMTKDSAHYGSTGGWRFQRFLGSDQAQSAIHDSGASCYQCHQKATAHGFVFSRLQ